MNGETAAAVVNMPLQNIIAFGVVAVIVGVMILVILIVLFRLMKKSGVSAVGPVKFQQEIMENQRKEIEGHQRREHKGQTNQHFMDGEIKIQDEICKTKCRNITNKLKGSLVHKLRDYNICMMGRRAIASATRFPLYEAVASNNFTHVLMPDQANEYRDGLICEIEQEYIQIYDDYQDTPCQQTAMPTWEEIQNMAKSAIDMWLRQIAAKVSETCKAKIEIYLKFRSRFEAENDMFRVGICDECIAKNKNYIRELERLIG
jgi:hypothetical protein